MSSEPKLRQTPSRVNRQNDAAILEKFTDEVEATAASVRTLSTVRGGQKVNIVSWNLQKRQIAYDALAALLDLKVDVFLLQEVPLQMVAHSHTGQKNDQFSDLLAKKQFKHFGPRTQDEAGGTSQDESVGCVTAILVRDGFANDRLRGNDRSGETTSGKIGSHRYSTHVTYGIDTPNPLHLVSLHATSIKGVAAKNTADIVAESSKATVGSGTYVIGGDLNSDANDYPISEWKAFAPDCPTQKSGGTLDGFYVKSSSPFVAKCEILKGFVLVTAGCDKNSHGVTAGVWTNVNGAAVTVSDHAPVHLDIDL